MNSDAVIERVLMLSNIEKHFIYGRYLCNHLFHEASSRLHSRHSAWNYESDNYKAHPDLFRLKSFEEFTDANNAYRQTYSTGTFWVFIPSSIYQYIYLDL